MHRLRRLSMAWVTSLSCDMPPGSDALGGRTVFFWGEQPGPVGDALIGTQEEKTLCLPSRLGQVRPRSSRCAHGRLANTKQVHPFSASRSGCWESLCICVYIETAQPSVSANIYFKSFLSPKINKQQVQLRSTAPTKVGSENEQVSLPAGMTDMATLRSSCSAALAVEGRGVNVWLKQASTTRAQASNAAQAKR